MIPSCPFLPAWRPLEATIGAWLWLAIPVLALTVAAGPLHAQAIRGRVIDDQSLEVVQGVTVALFYEDEQVTRTITDDDGQFFMALPIPGAYHLEAERLGYSTSVSQSFPVGRGDTVTVEFRIDPEAILLDPLLVVAHSGARGLFYGRKEEWGRGIFIEPEALDSIQPQHPADVLRNQEDLFLSWTFSTDCAKAQGGDGSLYCGPVPIVRNLVGSGCMQYMINNLPIRRTRMPWETGSPWKWFPLNHLRGYDIVAVEVYREIAEVPLDLRKWTDRDEDLGGVGLCGLTNFWTREVWDREGLASAPPDDPMAGIERSGWFRGVRPYLVASALIGAAAYLILNGACFGNCGG